MSNQLVRLDVDDGVARLELNRPDAANAMNLELATALASATEGLTHRDDVRAVLLTGAGDRFCGGGDVRSFADAGGDLDTRLGEIVTQLHVAVLGARGAGRARRRGSAGERGRGRALAGRGRRPGDRCRVSEARDGLHGDRLDARRWVDVVPRAARRTAARARPRAHEPRADRDRGAGVGTRRTGRARCRPAS